MKNHKKQIVSELKEAGFVYLRPARHGELYQRGEKIVEIPQDVDTSKLARNIVRKALKL